MKTDHDTSGEDGFSLIEVLCAFVILSISAGIALQTIQLATKSISIAEEKVQVLQLVPKVQASISTAVVNDQTTHGEMDGFHWEVVSISDNQKVGYWQVFHLRVNPEGSKRHYDFLISCRGRNEQSG